MGIDDGLDAGRSRGCAAGTARPRVLAAGLITGAIVAGFNMMLEYAGATLDVYYVPGPAVIVRTPLPLSLAWVFMTLVFVPVTVFVFELLSSVMGSELNKGN